MWGSVIAATVASAALAWWLHRGRYRRPTDQPRIQLHWWWSTPALTALSALFLSRTGSTTPITDLAYLVGAVAIALIDIDVHRLPDRFLTGWGAVVVAALLIETLTGGDLHTMLRAGLAAAALAVLYLLFAVIASMGLGDVKLALVTGAVLGAHSWQTVYLATLAAFAVAGAVAVLLLATRRGHRQDHLAFGPAIVAGAVLLLALMP